MEKLRLLSLFAGIGGFELGLERSGGFQTVAQCEIDPYCNKVLAKHWPEVKRYGDIRELTAARLAADGITVDAICGGFPCQDISTAGKGAGIEGERSGLWGEYARLIGELRPRVVFVENVAALLGRGLDRVLGDLAALGYDAWWDCIPASAVGAPHQRDRLWIMAYAAGERRREAGKHSKRRSEWVASRSQVLGHSSRSGRDEGHPDPRGGGKGAAQAQERAGFADDGRWSPEPDVGRVAARISSKLDGALDEKKLGADESAKGISDAGKVSGMRGDKQAGAAPSVLQQTGKDRDFVPALPHQGGPKGRVSQGQNAARLCAVRDGVHAEPQQEAFAVQPAMQVGDGPDKCAETLGQFWRVEPENTPRVAAGVKDRAHRLRALGNAVVPQIPELIGRAYLSAMTHPTTQTTTREMT